MKRLYASLILCALFLAGGSAVGGKDTRRVFREMDDAIERLDLKRARTLLTQLESGEAATPVGMHLKGKLLFFEGKHEEALTALRQSIEKAKTELDWKHLRDRVRKSKAVIDRLNVTPGTSGAFTFYHEDSTDTLLIPYADRALNAQRKELEKLLGVHFQTPLRIVILSDTGALSDMCGLTVDQIETTGTVGISKYNQIMILSPHIISSGYPWLDTLAHELTHIAITMKSRDNAPIWLHEGVAKLYENRWRGGTGGELAPEEAYILDRAAKEHRLIPLRRFHPSISLLPNQEDAALAYAQVLSFMLYLDRKISDADWVQSLLGNVGKGKQIDEELSRLTRFNLRKLFNWWEQEITGRRQAPVKLIPMMKKKFKSGVTAGYATEESLLSDSVRRHIRIGDLLRLRGHIKPATIEYKRALTLNEAAVPEITDRLGGCLLDLEDHKNAARMLGPVTELYPYHATALIQLASANASLGKTEAAAAALEKAIALDPFHPQVHCMLSKLYEKQKMPDKAQLEKDHCLLLSSRRKPN